MEKKQKHGKTPIFILAIVALVLLLLLLTIIYFSVFQPRQPLLTINAVLLQSGNNPNPNPSLPANATVAEILLGLTLCLNMSLQNPNTAAFLYANVGASMYYQGKQLGFVLVPGGAVRAKSTLTFAVFLSTIEPSSFLAMEPGGGDGDDAAMSHMLTVTTDVAIAGDVTVLGSFSHHTSVSSNCIVSISTIAQQVVAFNCGYDA